jgi:hypothetical protein
MIIRRGRSARRRCHRAAGVGAAVALVVALAGCGGGEKNPGVATADGGSGATPSAGAGVVAQYVEQQRKLAQCLRDQGFDVPDPDARGRMNLDALGGRNKTRPEVGKAWRECEEFNMEVPAELEDTPPPLTAIEVERRREYAECKRANGVPDFPDPGPDGNWDGNQAGDAMTDQEAAASNRSDQICHPVLDGKPATTPDPNAIIQG